MREMQTGGTLKKRTRRPVFKGNRFPTVPYNNAGQSEQFLRDNYTSKPSFVGYSDSDTRVNMKSLLARSTVSGDLKNSTRVTRNPLFHLMEDGMTMAYSETLGFDTAGGDQVTKWKHSRPYLLCEAVFTRLRIIVMLGMLSGNVPWRWNNKTKRINRWSSIMFTLWKFYWCLTVIQSLFMLLYHMRCFLGMYSRNLESYRGIFAYSTTLYWYACHLGYRTCMLLYEDDIRKYINRLQDFNEEYSCKYLIYADKGIESGVGRMVMKFSIPAAASQIANSVFLFLITPAAPYYLTSKVKPLRWYHLIPGALQDMTVTGHTIGTYLILSWLQVAHTSSVQFWLREMHKDIDSDYTTEGLRTPEVTIPTYKALQLMCTIYNGFMAACIPVWKFSVAFGFIPCGFLWIRSMNHFFIEEFPVYPFGVLNCFTMAFGYDKPFYADQWAMNVGKTICT
ncbi:hypothetical protein Ocin01_15459 [Orchesella cincta]|uniref:Uncharacterized protein n=1 Tax=Orchesella cincta TaxID=48709 RepID=A0A1D2ME58_ORCCI|nr:hypothetical protein Ocin01_15459 [Orchesella cincta]